MTLPALLAEADREIAEALLTLREVAEATQTPIDTIKRWAYRDRTLPVEHVGPTRRVRVRLSVLLRFFPPESVSFASIRHHSRS